MDRDKIWKMIATLAAIIVIATSLSKLFGKNAMSLSEYAALNKGADTSGIETTTEPTHEPSPEPDDDSPVSTASPKPDDNNASQSPSPQHQTALIGASLNGNSQLEQRISQNEDFYYEPVSDNLRRYMTGISYPATDTAEALPEITFDQLKYVHILHYNFDGQSVEGELVCHESIAADLVEIFQELYENAYQLESVLLIDVYEGNDMASMEANNTCCFNYRTVDGTERLSAHAFGLAVDINPLYNPYITYGEDNSEKVSPSSAIPYADRDASFPYKIDEDDLCYKLFIQHGFTWGGNWNNVKDYQHFQKTL